MIIMKRLTSLLIGCSLALAGAALAQQPVEEQQAPPKGKRAPEKAQATQTQPGKNAAKPQAPPATHQGATQQKQGALQQHGATGAIKQPGATNERSATSQPPAAEKGQKTHAGHEPANAAETKARSKSAGETANEPGAGKGPKARPQPESAKAPATGTDTSGQAAGMPTQRGKDQAAKERKPGEGVKQPATEAGATSATSAAGQQNAQANAGAKMKKPAPQQVQQVKSQHANFKAQPKPQQVQAVTFNQNHRIEGSDRWQGQQYEVFRSYRPEWHDAGWYHSHYPNVTLIAGGYYFFNAGYWYPAWGYNASAQYYAYDGPIYVGQRAVPPDQVIAQTQDLLQQMGYYTGEVDGLLGPLTREALTAYQNDNGLVATAAIDQPTLDSLGLA
jgi:Putative peptidoglycan binding domain